MSFIVSLKDGKFLVNIVEFRDNGLVLVETLDGKRAVVELEELTFI